MSEPAPPRREEWITDPRRFAELHESWDGLSSGSPFLTWDWLDCWWRAFGAGAQMRVHASWEGPALVAGMALCRRARHAWGMANEETDLYRPVARSLADQEGVLEALARGPWSRITLLGLPIGDPVTERLVKRLGARGWLIEHVFRESCPIVVTRGSLEDYLGGISSKLRGNVRRALRKLEDMGRVELCAVEPVGDLEQVLDESFALEAAGWKGRSRSAVLSSERSIAFWRSVFERFHLRGAVRSSQLRLEGRLVAFCLDLLHEGRLYTMKTSYDESYSRFSPGQILRLAMIERSFEDGIEAQELLGPAHPWKRRYATDARETAVVRAYRRRPLPASRYATRRWLMPRLRPVYNGARGALDRFKGHRGAAPA